VQLRPRYDGPPILRIDAGLPNPTTAMVRQRRRLAKELAELDGEGWTTPSRCDAWTVQDVVTHLVSTNQFWAISVAQGLAGAPTRFLATFDPVASPAQMVDSARGKATPAETLEQYTASIEALAAAVEPLTDDQVATVVAEAPPGHVTLDAVVLHALWDAWIHERDVLLPLGRAQDREDDEIAGCLAYASALGPAFAASGGSTEASVFGVESTDGSLRYVVHAGEAALVEAGPPPGGAPVLRGDAIDLIEALSLRGPFPDAASLDPSIKRLVGGLADVFDTEVA
jgi:uncharacterized protein (TIGR03083 family)